LADQKLESKSRMFTLDLHGVLRNEAIRAIRLRLRECYKYGLRTLRVAFGSPDRYEGTILEGLCETLQVDPNVIIGELPDWVFEPELKRDPRIIFLTVPIRPNPTPEPLGEKTIFQKFNATKEEKPGQRLLCGTPFQPFRTRYDWKYAARAIGGTCSEGELATMCTQLGLVPLGADGLTIETLMRSAELYPKWVKNRPAERKIATLETLAPDDPDNVPSFPPLLDEIDGDLPGGTQPGAWDYLRLFDRMLENGSYGQAAQALISLESLCNSDELLFEFVFRKARLLLREHDPTCETCLLGSDELCVKVYGERSVRRRQVIELLQFWYSSTGESGRVLHYAEIAGRYLPREGAFSRDRRLQSEFVFAAHLSATARHEDSIRTLGRALWEIVFEKEGEMPLGFRLDQESLRNSGISMELLTRVVFHLAKDSIELGDTKDALAYLRLTEGLGKLLSTDYGLKAEIYNQMGRALRRSGRVMEALEYYQLAITEAEKEEDPDPELMYLIYLNRGVALANSEDLRMAGKAYARAEKYGLEAYDSDHPELFRLRYSQTALLLKRRNFSEAAKVGTRAAEILELKGPERVSEIALAYMRVGEAKLCSRKYPEALLDLKKAEMYWSACKEPTSPERLNGLRALLVAAENGVAGRI
jgi:tetratricopeptide (TPR) repeat protein